jgi:hypothetical protein
MPVLDVDQRKILLQVLDRMFSKIEVFTLFIKDKCGKNSDRIATGTLPVLFSAIVDHAEDNEWTMTLLKQLHLAAEERPDAKALLDSLGSLDDIREARFFDAIFVAPRPFVNRKDLRAKLRALSTNSAGKRILVVRSSPDTPHAAGKTHALYHIVHIAERLDIKVAPIALSEYGGEEEITPRDLGEAIVSALELEIPEFDEKPSRWSLNFLAWLAGKIDPKRTRLWIVIDDFQKVPVPPTVYDFITLLADRIDTVLARLRLILISYEAELPKKLKPIFDREDVTVITDKDLASYFADYFDQHLPPRNPSDAADAIVKLTARVRAEMTGDPAEQLTAMRDAIITACQDLDRGVLP